MKKEAYHVVIDLDGVRECPFIHRPEEVMEQFLDQLCRIIKMNALTPPIVKTGNDHNPGVSGIMMIDTSHIASHQFSYGRQVRIDIYSCKAFSIALVDALVDIYYPSDKKQIQVIERWPVAFPGQEGRP